jgi:hypothetical protein
VFAVRGDVRKQAAQFFKGIGLQLVEERIHGGAINR